MLEKIVKAFKTYLMDNELDNEFEKYPGLMLEILVVWTGFSVNFMLRLATYNKNTTRKCHIFHFSCFSTLVRVGAKMKKNISHTF